MAVHNLHLDACLVVGDALMFTAAILVLNGSRVKGVLQLRKSWKFFEETKKKFDGLRDKLHPELVNCMDFGVGFFLFALSIIPSKYLRFAQIAGFRADRDEGLKAIRATYESGRLRRPLATAVLLFNGILVPRGISDVSALLDEATEICDKAIAQYPEGSAWRVMAAQAAKKRLDLEGAKEHYRVCLEACKKVTGKVPTLLAYEYASVHVMLLDFDKAIELLEPILKEPPFKMYTICAAQLAGCYINKGEAEKANAVWKDIIARFGKSSSATVSSIVKLFENYVVSGGLFTTFEILYFRRDLSKMTKLDTRLLEILDDLARKAKILDAAGAIVPAKASTKLSENGEQQQAPKEEKKKGFSFKSIKESVKSIGKKDTANMDFTNDNRASYMLMKAAILKTLRGTDDKEAITLLEDVTKMHGALIAKWFLPYAYYELCESYSKAGLLDKATEALKKCITFKDYPWEDPLKVRIRVTTDQIKAISKTDITDDDGGSLEASSEPGGSGGDDDAGSDAPPPPRPPKPSK